MIQLFVPNQKLKTQSQPKMVDFNNTVGRVFNKKSFFYFQKRGRFNGQTILSNYFGTKLQDLISNSAGIRLYSLSSATSYYKIGNPGLQSNPPTGFLLGHPKEKGVASRTPFSFVGKKKHVRGKGIRVSRSMYGYTKQPPLLNNECKKRLIYQKNQKRPEIRVNSYQIIKNLDNYISMEYSLESYHRSNQDTCLTHKPSVFEGQWVESGDLLADCSTSIGGELSLGQNILIGYMPWEGYNFEDAILISERLVYDDLYTSIHIEKYEINVEETKLGIEEITRDIPEVQNESIKHLNSLGIAKLGSWVEEGDILVGKVTPINKKNQSNYQKLLYLILDKTTSTVRDSSLRAPKGIKAKVIGIQVFKNNSKETPSFSRGSLNSKKQNPDLKEKSKNLKVKTQFLDKSLRKTPKSFFKTASFFEFYDQRNNKVAFAKSNSHGELLIKQTYKKDQIDSFSYGRFGLNDGSPRESKVHPTPHHFFSFYHLRNSKTILTPNLGLGLGFQKKKNS